jgi:aquaporin TIP/aquaporin related protein
MRIMLFEFIGTALFAYGIISSRGSDAAIAVALFGGIFISAKFSGGHVLTYSKIYLRSTLQ